MGSQLMSQLQYSTHCPRSTTYRALMIGLFLPFQIQHHFPVPITYTIRFIRGGTPPQISLNRERRFRSHRSISFCHAPSSRGADYLFHPLSDIASIPVGFFTINSSTVYQDTQMVSSGYLTGNYSRAYNASIFTPNGALPPPPFKPGIYTVVAGDEWGQMVILHFSVAVASAYTSTTITVTSASSISSTTLTFSSCSTVINVNGTEYCALDVSSDILLGNPGYSYFMTADAIVFNGVTFRTICPSGYQGCPNVSADKTITQLTAGDIVVRLSFQDGTNETVGSVIGDLSGNLTILSIHGNPRAGILITGLYRTFLLVEASTSTTCLLEVPKTAVFGQVLQLYVPGNHCKISQRNRRLSFLSIHAPFQSHLKTT